MGPIEEEIEYDGAALIEPKYGAVGGILAPILTGSQPGAAPTWNWR
ncbi:hypothetical protein So717_40630 [Roseobacter cerasinus]|uniref:Uncharacterized protein n=1 Tax=Roseobacter cerasinus TaxID=2602289 RepID=A0A640VY60_9RHOB|nr:hypothetical protein So717_40630 [Roseobacter cerasinus]